MNLRHNFPQCAQSHSTGLDFSLPRIHHDCKDEATPVEIEYLEPDRVVQVAAAGATTARRSFAEHLIATKALRCTATAWMLIVAESFAKF